MLDSNHSAYLDPILARHLQRPENLVQMLREAQEYFGYVHPLSLIHI